MEFQNYATLSPAVKAQVCRVKEVWLRLLGGDVAGVYLHGSVALGRFVEGVSDIDMLVVTQRRMSRDERLAAAREMIDIDGQPASLEMSAVWRGHLWPWRHPTPCQFHYSSAWTDRYRLMLSGAIAEHFLLDQDFEDPDIACHGELTRQSGICVYGEPASGVFPPVPPQDFWQSIAQDVETYSFHAYEPRCLPSNILVLARILSYKQLGRVLSKYDAGLWVLERLPERCRPVVHSALSAWYNKEEMAAYSPEQLEELRQFLLGEILGKDRG